MKKQRWIALMLALALTAACGSGALADHDAETVTGEAIAAANGRDAILTAHESVLLVNEDMHSGTTTACVTKDFCFIQAGDAVLYDDAGTWKLLTNDGERMIRYEWYAVEGVTDDRTYLEFDPVFNLEILLTERLEAVRDNGDGTMTAVIAQEPGSLLETLEEYDAADPEIPAGAPLMIDIVLDAETLEIQSYEEYGLRADGERMVLSSTAVTYDADVPADAAEIRAASAAFRAGAPADPRTITIIYDHGTDYEERYSITADRSFKVHPNTYYGYDLWYSDAERTQVFAGTDGAADVTVYAFAPGAYLYGHDPRLNPKVLEDAVADDSAVYGFRPSETGSLKMYAEADWTDPEAVAAGRVERIAYHESLQTMYDKLAEMRAAGEDIETIARTLSAMRNELRLAAYADDPEGLAAIKARNLEKYGHEEGPLAEEMFEKYGSWETVLVKAFSPNAAMDACLGFYDDYYDLYVAAGWIAEENATPARRQYAVAAFVDSFWPWVEDSGAALSDFADAGEIADCFSPEWEWAVESGLVKGYEDATLRPQETIRRIEAFVLLSRCLPELEAVGEPVVFTDVPDWAKADIDRLSAAGLLLGYGDGILGAEDALTVEQVSILLARAAA